MIQDLKLDTADDLVIDDNDCVLISDIDLLVQDLYNQIRCFYYTWALDLLYGTYIAQYVNMPDEPIKLVEIKNDIKQILRRDARIVKDSYQIKIKQSAIEVQFLPVGREQPITLTLEAK